MHPSNNETYPQTGGYIFQGNFPPQHPAQPQGAFPAQAGFPPQATFHQQAVFSQPVLVPSQAGFPSQAAFSHADFQNPAGPMNQVPYPPQVNLPYEGSLQQQVPFQFGAGLTQHGSFSYRPTYTPIVGSLPQAGSVNQALFSTPEGPNNLLVDTSHRLSEQVQAGTVSWNTCRNQNQPADGWRGAGARGGNDGWFHQSQGLRHAALLNETKRRRQREEDEYPLEGRIVRPRIEQSSSHSSANAQNHEPTTNQLHPNQNGLNPDGDGFNLNTDEPNSNSVETGSEAAFFQEFLTAFQGDPFDSEAVDAFFNETCPGIDWNKDESTEDFLASVCTPYK